MRPAFNLDLTSVLFTSAAVGGKADSTVDGNLTEVAAYDGNEWKLTLKDGDRSGFTASTTSATTQVENYSNWTVDVAYSGAQTGSNEYVSAMLVDSSGSVLYYGRVAQNSASGEASITIPTGLAVGSYTLKVFSEQYNGDKKTDYASAFTDIPDGHRPRYRPGQQRQRQQRQRLHRPQHHLAHRAPGGRGGGREPPHLQRRIGGGQRLPMVCGCGGWPGLPAHSRGHRGQPGPMAHPGGRGEPVLLPGIPGQRL